MISSSSHGIFCAKVISSVKFGLLKCLEIPMHLAEAMKNAQTTQNSRKEATVDGSDRSIHITLNQQVINQKIHTASCDKLPSSAERHGSGSSAAREAAAGSVGSGLAVAKKGQLRLCICMYVCMYVCMYACVCIHAFMHA
jgi:hypothetical protein